MPCYIAKIKPLISQYHFTDRMLYPFPEYRAVVDKGVEFSVFAAGVDVRRQFGEERPIELPARKPAVEV